MDEHAKNVVDVLSAGTLVGVMVGLLPHMATVLTIVWMLLRIYETNTVQQLLNRCRRD